MPAESEEQRKAAGAALAVKRGKQPKSSLKGAARSMLSMTEDQLRDYARRPRTTSEAAGLGRSRGAKRAKGKSKSHSNPHPKPRTTSQVAGKRPADVGGTKRKKRRVYQSAGDYPYRQ